MAIIPDIIGEVTGAIGAGIITIITAGTEVDIGHIIVRLIIMIVDQTMVAADQDIHLHVHRLQDLLLRLLQDQVVLL